VQLIQCTVGDSRIVLHFENVLHRTGRRRRLRIVVQLHHYRLVRILIRFSQSPFTKA
jgi:hypothetical protein